LAAASGGRLVQGGGSNWRTRKSTNARTFGENGCSLGNTAEMTWPSWRDAHPVRRRSCPRVCATKAYHTIGGVGARYLVSLFDLNTGALAALIDGRRTTDFRTGGASGVVARRMAFDGDDAAKVARLG
jgi:hypothetical protein